MSKTSTAPVETAPVEMVTVKSAIPPRRTLIARAATTNGQWDTAPAVAFWEKNPVHENGEAFIGDDKPHRVAVTERLLEALRAGKLVVVECAPGSHLAHYKQQ